MLHSDNILTRGHTRVCAGVCARVGTFACPCSMLQQKLSLQAQPSNAFQEPCVLLCFVVVATQHAARTQEDAIAVVDHDLLGLGQLAAAAEVAKLRRVCGGCVESAWRVH